MGVLETKYIVISPMRDEEEHVQSTIRSMANQTVRPLEWIVVNDGSTDATGKILEEGATKYPWIHPVHRQNRGFRKSGGGVVEAFNDGLKELRTTDWDFIVKLDGDLEFDPDYFEKCFTHFEQEPKLGVGGGVICYVDENGGRTFEETPAFHVRGATKIYRRKVWDAIGGFWPAPGWDTIDEVKANMLGWSTRSFPELPLIHHRVTGSADGWLGGIVKNGRANYVTGYHPLFMFAKCMFRVTQKPPVLGSLALMYGFLSGYFKGVAQVDDPRMIRYLRAEQMKRLFGRETALR